ncbi:hypothetical protein OK016_27255 [Vibrio chagasii]|nr:hypothetical protein [Vibrio chagasii]
MLIWKATRCNSRKRIVKNPSWVEATAFRQQRSWRLHSQVGQFQRHTSIIHSQHISTGHYASGEGEVTALFSEERSAHLRYLISDIISIATMRALSAHRCHL